MDKNYKIYEANPEDIPAEDEARLDGYLKGLEDHHKEIQKIQKRIEELEDEIQDI